MANGKPKLVALIAVARKLLTILNVMIRTKTTMATRLTANTVAHPSSLRGATLSHKGRGCGGAAGKGENIRLAVIRRQQSVADQIARRARPGFVGVAAHVGAGGRDHVAGLDVAQVDVDVEDEVGDLLHHAGDGEVGAEFAAQLDVAAAAGLQIGVRAALTGAMSRSWNLPESASPLRT